jgi:hypothetical protein
MSSPASVAVQKNPHHLCRKSEMRTSEPEPHEINTLLGRVLINSAHGAGREISEQEQSRIGDVGVGYCHSCERGRGVLDSPRLEATTARRVARK